MKKPYWWVEIKIYPDKLGGHQIATINKTELEELPPNDYTNMGGVDRHVFWFENEADAKIFVALIGANLSCKFEAEKKKSLENQIKEANDVSESVGKSDIKKNIEAER